MPKNTIIVSIFVLLGLYSVCCENYYYSLDNIQKSKQEYSQLCQFITEDLKEIKCQIETGSFASESNVTDEDTPFENLKIVEYNIDRNGLGGDGPNEKGIAAIIDSIKSLGDPDIILLSEAARDCPQWNGVDGTQEIAKAFQMYWAYSVEFLELNSVLLNNGYQCTIGNAILSKKPLSNVIQNVFDSQCCMFGGRAGARVAIKATIQAYNLTIISSHLESGTGITDFIQSMLIREKQSKELVQMIDSTEQNNMILIGGDFNSPLRQFSKGKVFKSFYDPLMSKYFWPHRNTVVGDELGIFGLAAFDYLYFKNHEAFEIEGNICKTDECTGFSDHYPLQIEITRK